MLRDVRHHVTDGLLGFDSEKGDGVSVKIGASPVVSTAPVTITGDMDAAAIQNLLGLSPLADAAMDSVQNGAGRLYCIPVAAATKGTAGEVKKEGDGTGTVTVKGEPSNAFSVIVSITAQGGLNTAAFTASVDGGYRFTDETTVPVSGEYTLEGTGLTLCFSGSIAELEERSASPFLVGDRFSFQTTAPAMTNGDVLGAIEKLKGFNREYELVHITGESALPLWQAVSAAQKELAEVYKKPVFFLMEAASPETEDGGLGTWASRMEADRTKVANTDIQVSAAWGRLVRLDGTTRAVNLAGVAAGLYAKAPVQVSIGKTLPEAGFAVPESRLTELLPAELDNAVLQTLDEAGFLTFRQYDGLGGSYVYHTKMFCPPKSDFRYAEDVRVKNKIIRETRKEALLYLNDDIDLEDIQGSLEAVAKFIFVPLQKMIDAKEISSAEITVPAGQEESFLESETLRVKIRYVSRGYIREIEADLGRARPAAG